MKIKNVEISRRGIAVIAIFLIVLLCAGILLKLKLEDILEDSMESRLTEQVEITKSSIGNNIADELERLADMSDKLPAHMDLVTEESESGVYVGVLSPDGKAVAGKTLSVSGFSGIWASFEGENAVSYCEGKGLLCTVPVYEGEHISYVLYRLYEDDTYHVTAKGMVQEEDAVKEIRMISAVYAGVGIVFLLLLIAAFVYVFLLKGKAVENQVHEEEKITVEESNRAKSDFLANMSHEIRTPINAVMGMNEMVLRETKDENIRNYAHNIQNASQALLSLINGVLDFTKIEAGRMEIVENEYCLHTLVNEIVNMIEVKADQKELLFLARVDRNLPDVLCGDEGRIRQVVDNILNNAVKYTKEGKVMFVVSGTVDRETNTVELQFKVTDTGVGIRRADLPKLFRNFERLDLIKNRSIEGIGLGLPISYQLVQMMDGKLEVDSTYGEGSVFTVTIPQKIVDMEPIGDYRKDHRNEMDGLSAEEHLIAENAEVLVVDDNDMNLFVVKNLLKYTKARVSLCHSGKECLKMMQRKHYDIIFLDHMMPELDGIETMKISKTLKNNKCTDTPIVALTANAIVGVKEMYLNEGFDDYLSKPVNGMQLEQMLRKYLPEDKQQIGKQSDIEKEDADVLAKNRRAINSSGENTSKMTVIQILQPGGIREKKEEASSEQDSELKYLDIETGIEYSGGDKEMYKEFLAMFCDMKEENDHRIMQCFDARDWKNYVTQVHALKSTSLTVGATKLSEEAKALEKAGKEFLEQDGTDVPGYILAHHEEVMELYNITNKEAQEWLKKNGY